MDHSQGISAEKQRGISLCCMKTGTAQSKVRDSQDSDKKSNRCQLYQCKFCSWYHKGNRYYQKYSDMYSLGNCKNMSQQQRRRIARLCRSNTLSLKGQSMLGKLNRKADSLAGCLKISMSYFHKKQSISQLKNHSNQMNDRRGSLSWYHLCKSSSQDRKQSICCWRYLKRIHQDSQVNRCQWLNPRIKNLSRRGNLCLKDQSRWNKKNHS